MKRCTKLNKQQIEEIQNKIKNKNSSGREVRRALSIIMVDNRTKISEISVMTNYGERQIFSLRNKYLKEGIKVIEDKRKKKTKELLTKKQRKEIVDLVKQKKPTDYGYECEYWTTLLLGDLIESNYGVKFKLRTSYYLLFKQAKFSYHKPGRVYHNQDDKEVAEWRQNVREQVKKAFYEKNTVILTEDEMVLSTQTTFQKIWLPQGEYPKIEVSNKKESRSIYGFLNIKNGVEHSFKKDWQNMYITVEVLREIRKIYPQEKLLILWDGAGWHRGSKTQEFIKKDKNIETIYFPKYAPEQNPQEHVWKNGRDNVTHDKFIENIDNASDDFVTYLNNTKFEYKLLGFSAVL